jgi:hypothetical protein
MEKYGVINNNPIFFRGLKNYQKELVNKAIENVYVCMYLKMSGNIFYFEHADYETDEYDLKSNEKTSGRKIHVKMDWVVFGFDSVLERTQSIEGEQNDLVVAIDVFQNGKSKLRIHYPDCYKETFKKHYCNFDGTHEDYMFSTFDEDNYARYIEDIVKLV